MCSSDLGMIEPDWELASFQIGMKVSNVTLEEFQGRVISVNGSLWLVNFIVEQYGTLSTDCRPHRHVLSLIERHGIDLDLAMKGYCKGINTLQEQDKNQDQDQNKTKAKTIKSIKSRGTLEDLKSFCREIGLFPRDAEAMFYKWESNGWTNSGKPIKCWKSVFRQWQAAGYHPSQKNPSSADFWPSEAIVTSQPSPPEESLLEKWERCRAANEAKLRLEEGTPPPDAEPSDEIF